MGFFDFLDSFFGEGGGRTKIRAKCPKCSHELDTSMQRCPGCGTHVDLMFRLKCPNCNAPNPLDAKECTKCKENLQKKDEKPQGVRYICPICGYRADFYMLKCPACSTRFA